MSELEHIYATAIAAVASSITALPPVETVRELSDTVLLDMQRTVAAERKALDAHAALLAGEVANRSRPEDGYSGLAAREGFKNPVALVKGNTGLTTKEATTLVTVGKLVNDAEADPVTGEVTYQWPWLSDVGAAVAAGELSPQVADAIRVGLGEPVDTEGRQVTVEQLALAASRLLARDLSPDDMQRAAREERDALDTAGVREREKAIHEERSFRKVLRPNGAVRYIIDADLESAAFIDELCDKLMSPRRNGPRFVDHADQEWADGVSADTRTPAQYLHDSITGLIELAATSNAKENRKIVGSRKPSVRVLVTGDALQSGDGMGHIEGRDLPVSIQTVERLACSDGTVQIRFDTTGQIIDLGREERLFNPAQKLALAARDGGCVCCGAPPNMTEAHHITHWAAGGTTNIADGVLLCRFCHMLLHNNGWRIYRDTNGYWLVPPPDVDPEQTPRPLTRQSAVLRDLQRETHNTGQQSA
jgi:hypothetical protein